jgi:heme/copper-type cytochrome/quinol oxidase subunit 1
MLILFFGSNFLFYPLHSVGLYAFPRRISEFPFDFKKNLGGIGWVLGRLFLLGIGWVEFW